jgi:hypothetical protein
MRPNANLLAMFFMEHADLMQVSATVTKLPHSRNADVEWTAR